MKKVAIILANLGGPDNLAAVQPFLFNLFNDKAIITLPQPLRWIIAKFISIKRTPIAQEIYSQIGGRSPILEQTKRQAQELEIVLNKPGNYDAKVFVVMRHWKPFSRDVIKAVKQYQPDGMVFIPLYPQFSTTTTGSAIADWKKTLKKQRIAIPCKYLGCYPREISFIKAHIDRIKPVYSQAKKQGNPRLLFSAHGLPKKVVENGDPYQWQVKKTVEDIVEGLAIENLDYHICYQSKVGRLEWLTPSIDSEIIRAGREKIPVVVVPITFVSEHSETWVELDIEYKKLAEAHGVTAYFRVPTLGVHKDFIKSLADLCHHILCGKVTENKIQIQSDTGKRNCPKKFSKCICNG